ncbi:hypothetical protein [Prolixibacter bellariivorans]|uniref:hypothetical protein n=1 Tax=Prolixibacter bellariivorans TaxID=314319 RepID=UPI0004841B59|nr:hypothetical protein [Prolixibacter bellariivorans]
MYIGTSQSDPFPRVMVLFFRTHIPEYPHKTNPVNAGPADFDGPTRFSPNGEVEGEAMLKKKPQ